MHEAIEALPTVSQLTLPIDGSHFEAPPAIRVPKLDRVFVNRNLKMASIDWIGFDMDYTLAIYHQAAMDTLSVDLTVSHMIERGYPKDLKNLEFDIRFPIRGLLVDKRLGHVLKMDRFKAIYKGYHGMKRLPREELHSLYHDQRIRHKTPRYHWIDTLFSLSEVTSYVAIIDALEKRGMKVDYARLFQDVRDSIDQAHREGEVYRTVTADLPKFILRDPELAQMLHKFRSGGKKLFLLTNSPWHYTDRVMSYLLGNAMSEYPSWRQYFDVVTVAAQKPRWFQGGRPFMELDGNEGKPVRGPLERGKVYEGGNLQDFERLQELRGSEVLYVGDHIFGDILRSKKESAWRTAMIIQELDDEVFAHEKCNGAVARQRELEDMRARLEDELRFYQTRLKGQPRSSMLGGKPTAEKQRLQEAVENIRRAIHVIDVETEGLHDYVDTVFHPYWGSLLKEGKGLSSFGVQVENYADIYMRRVSGLRHYSPQQLFRSPHDLMPHEL